MALRKLPKQLIAEPMVVRAKTPEEERAEDYQKFDRYVQEAAQKNAEVTKLVEQRQWKPAKAPLDAIFHPVLRNATLYRAVSAYAEVQRLKNSIGMEFAFVPAGESSLGGGGGTPGTTRFVLPKPLLCGIYPVTQAEWQAVMGNNPSNFSGNPRYPVEPAGEGLDVLALPGRAVLLLVGTHADVADRRLAIIGHASSFLGNAARRARRLAWGRVRE